MTKADEILHNVSTALSIINDEFNEDTDIKLNKSLNNCSDQDVINNIENYKDILVKLQNIRNMTYKITSNAEHNARCASAPKRFKKATQSDIAVGTIVWLNIDKDDWVTWLIIEEVEIGYFIDISGNNYDFDRTGNYYIADENGAFEISDEKRISEYAPDYLGGDIT